MKRTSVILADDHPIVAAGLKRLLEPGCRVIASVADGEALVALAVEHRPDLIISDISLRRLDGIEAARRIRAAGVDSRIVMLTNIHDTACAGAALEAGASGYVLKQSEPAELLAAISAALNGSIFVTPHVASKLEEAGQSPGSPRPSNGTLPFRKREILRLLAGGRTAKEMAAALDVSHKTIEYHKYRMMRELKLETSADLIRYAVTHGIA